MSTDGHMSNQPATLEPSPASSAAAGPPLTVPVLQAAPAEAQPDTVTPTAPAPAAKPPAKAAEAPPPPLSTTASRLLTAWMADQRVSLAFTTYQSSKLILLGRTPEVKI